MPGIRRVCRPAAQIVLAAVVILDAVVPSAQRPIRPLPEALAAAAPELLDRIRADPFAYFRFINRAWTARVCETFADVKNPTIVRLHGDAHVEQFALTKDAWGLDDFDDSTRGPAFVDVVRFLASLDLAARERGWTNARDALWDRFLEGYRRGLTDPDYLPPEPDIVRRLRTKVPPTAAAYLAWGESQMLPMEKATSESVVTSMAAFEHFIRGERQDLAPGYFAVVRAGWLHIGVGSASARKILVRVEGPTARAEDDVLIEAKEVTNLGGLECLEDSTTPQTIRVVDGTRQLGRLKHDVLAVGPTLLIPAAVNRAEHWLEWWLSSWEPSYREVHLDDLRSPNDLADIAFDSGVQLGAGKVVGVRRQELASIADLERRLRKETSSLVEQLLAGWRELGQEQRAPAVFPRGRTTPETPARGAFSRKFGDSGQQWR